MQNKNDSCIFNSGVKVSLGGQKSCLCWHLPTDVKFDISSIKCYILYTNRCILSTSCSSNGSNRQFVGPKIDSNRHFDTSLFEKFLKLTLVMNIHESECKTVTEFPLHTSQKPELQTRNQFTQYGKLKLKIYQYHIIPWFSE